MRIRIYCDGACSGNPGPGGWASVMLLDNQNSPNIVKGGENVTTNNRMELKAAIEGLKAICTNTDMIDYTVHVYTDSIYLKNGITVWIKKWIKNNWKSASGAMVKNIDLWQELHGLSKDRQIVWEWVKAHSGDFYNEMADKEARSQVY